ncbi:MAG: hypothetical protein GX575_31685 [Candidatus Anammoximicrobium sp.]|nr:hypothetical protein [Candidatus Anammoximicrobium sp.]
MNVSITQMAAMCSLSRARFYQLLGTTFPWPIYDVATRRPFYDDELQAVCLDVRKRNCGIDGKPLLFYSRRVSTTTTKPQRNVTKRSPSKPNNNHASLIAGIAALGLDVSAAQVESAVSTLYPNGLDDVAQGDVLRSVFLQIRRQNAADNVR